MDRGGYRDSQYILAGPFLILPSQLLCVDLVLFFLKRFLPAGRTEERKTDILPAQDTRGKNRRFTNTISTFNLIEGL